MAYKGWGNLGDSHGYNVALFKLAMQKTESEYPAYVFTQYRRALRISDGYREVARGDFANLIVAPPAPKEHPRSSDVIRIPVPVMKGLMGYRKLVVRSSERDKFSKINSAQQLKQYRVGLLGKAYQLPIYETAGYAVTGANSHFRLFKELEKKKFDFIPVDVLHADRLLEKWNSQNMSLDVLESFLIYYPVPTIFQVNANEPLLAERLQRGLEIAAGDGSMDALFDEYFASLIMKLDVEDRQLILLDNPQLDAFLGLSEPVLLKHYM